MENILNISLDIERIKNNIDQYSSVKLCEMIVCNRYFGINQEITVFCMEELAKRRINGDDFNFEKFIEDSNKELPELNFSIPNFKDILHQAIKKIK